MRFPSSALCLLWLFLVIFVSSSGSAKQKPEKQPLTVLDSTADFVQSDSVSPPTDATWTAVELPHEWPNIANGPTLGWYRFPISDPVFEEPQAVYLWRFAMNAGVWLNEQYLGDGGSLKPPITRNWNYPLVFLLPESAIQSNQNYLYVNLATYPGWSSFQGVVIGPHDVLQEEYNFRYRWQITGSRITFVICLTAAFIALILWLANRSNKLYLSFSLASIAGATFCLNLFIQTIPVEPRIWSWLIHSALDWYGVGLGIFGLTLLQVKMLWFRRLIVLYGVVATFIYGFFTIYQFLHVSPYVHVAAILVGLAVVVIGVVQYLRTRRLEMLAFTLCQILMMGLSLHDMGLDLAQGEDQWKDNVYLLHYAFPVLMLTMLFVLTRQFADSFKKLAYAERAVIDERERVYSDIHDDIGSKMLSMVYAAESDSQQKLARETLGEIRTIVSGGMRHYGSLSEMSQECEAEARSRCRSVSIQMSWHGEGLVDVTLPDPNYYHLQRILRELITNAIKHADTRAIDVMVRIVDQTLTLTVTDFGETKNSVSEFQHGNGMHNIQRRVADMSGSVRWETLDTGCCVTIEVPIAPDNL